MAKDINHVEIPPEEYDKRIAEVQAKWTEETRLRRYYCSNKVEFLPVKVYKTHKVTGGDYDD
jgi:hypothetical protein